MRREKREEIKDMKFIIVSVMSTGTGGVRNESNCNQVHQGQQTVQAL
jgi:hypothetical protein